MGTVAFSTAQDIHEIHQSDLEEIASILGEQARTCRSLPKLVNAPFARGKMLARQLQPGLFVTAYDLEYLEDHVIEVDEDPSLRCGVMFEGPARPLEIAGLGKISTEPHCPFVIGFGEKTRCKGYCDAGTRSAGAGFKITSAFFDSHPLAEGETDELEPLRVMLASKTAARSFPRSLSFSDFAERTLDNPYTGVMSELFLEGCILAMVAEATCILTEDNSSLEASGLSAREFERTSAARKIVDRRIVAPPSLAELSRLLGVNVTTLSRQFRLAFGDTIFGYVRGRRLEIARMLLRNEALSIAEIGYRVGFANAGAFATAYRKRFGRSPSADRRPI